MDTITIRLNSEEARIYKEYARFKNIPLLILMKEALEEKIEDEIDLRAILVYEERLKNNETEYISFLENTYDPRIFGKSLKGNLKEKKVD